MWDRDARAHTVWRRRRRLLNFLIDLPQITVQNKCRDETKKRGKKIEIALARKRTNNFLAVLAAFHQIDILVA